MMRRNDPIVGKVFAARLAVAIRAVVVRGGVAAHCRHRRRDSNFRVERYVLRVRQRKNNRVAVDVDVVGVFDRLDGTALAQTMSRIQSVAKPPRVMCTHAIRNIMVCRFCLSILEFLPE